MFRTSDNEHIMMPFPEFTSFFMIKQDHFSTDYFFPFVFDGRGRAALELEAAGKEQED